MMNKPTMRPLTDRELEHIAKLIRRGGEAGLAQLIDSTDGTIRMWQSRDRWPVLMIERAMLLKVDDVPKKVTKPRPRPPKGSRMMGSLTRSELSYYRED